MASFALPDVVTPCVLGGAAIGEPFHELRTVLFVTEVETAFGDDGVVITGAAPRNSTSIDAAAVAGDTARAAPPSWGVSPWSQSSGGLRAGRPSPPNLSDVDERIPRGGHARDRRLGPADGSLG